MTEKLLYCYNCKSLTIYNNIDTHGNSGVDSHCSNCGLMAWQNRAVEREKDKWVQHNRREEEKWKLVVEMRLT